MHIVESRSPGDAYQERALKIGNPFKCCHLGVMFDLINKKRIILPPLDKVLLSAGPSCMMPRNGYLVMDSQIIPNPEVLVYIQSEHGGLFAIAVENFSPRDIAISRGSVFCVMKLIQRAS